MKHLTMRFVNSNDLLGWSIDWVTFSLWDHVEFGTPAGTWLGAHYHTGVAEHPANYLHPSRERRYAVPVEDAAYDAVMAEARRLIGTPYNLRGIGGLLLHVGLSHPHQLICSQYWMDCLIAGGLWWLNVQPGFTNRVTPEIAHFAPALIGHCTSVFPGEVTA